MMNLKGVSCIGAVTAMLFAGSAMADDGPRYTYLEGGWGWVDIDEVNEDGDGFNLGGSLGVTDMVFLFVDYNDSEIDVDSFDVDYTTTEVGLGGNIELSPTADLVGSVSWVNVDLDAGGFGDVDEDGYGLFLGVRAMMTPQFELNGGVSYVDIDDADDTALEIGAVYNFTDVFAVTVDASFGDEFTTYGIGVRAYLQ